MRAIPASALFVLFACGSGRGPTPPSSNAGGSLETLNAANAAIAAHASDVILTPDGRTHLLITWNNNFRTQERIEVDGVTQWTRDSTASQSVERDHRNAQGILERTRTVTFGPTPMDTTAVVTLDPAGNGQYTRRETYTLADSTTLNVAVETATPPGALTNTDNYTTPTRQAAVVQGPTSTGAANDCTAAQRSQVVVDMEAALRRGLDSCLLSGLDPHLDACLRNAAAQGVKLSCGSLPGTEFAEVGAWDALTTGGFGGPLDITVDPSRYFGTSDDARQLILWHEMNHVCLGVHNPFDISTGANEDISVNDKVYACAGLCFDPNATKCQCASCLGVDQCDPKCKRFKDCSNEAKCNCAINHKTYKDLTSCKVACPSGVVCFAAGCDPVPQCP